MNLTEKKEMEFKELFRKEGMEKAPHGFTQNIMAAIFEEKQVHLLTNKPIIPLFWKYTVGFVILGMLIYSTYNISTISYVDYLASILAKQKGAHYLQWFVFEKGLSAGSKVSSNMFLWVALFFGAGSISLLVNQKMFAGK